MSRRDKGAKRAAGAPAKHPVLAIIIISVAVIAVAAALAIWFIKPEVYHKYLGIGEHTFTEWHTEKEPTCGESGERYRECTVCGEEERETLSPTGEHDFDGNGVCRECGFDSNGGSLEGVAASDFSVHIIDLGKYAGDSIYIKAAGNDILIDAGSRASSAELICEYLSGYVTDGKLEYVIATHADQDHIAAFAGNSPGKERTGVLYKYEVGTLIKFDNVESGKADKSTDTSTVYGKFCAAVKYARGRGTAVYTAGQCYRGQGGAQRQYFLDEERTLSMNILYNYYYDHVSSDENNHSVVTLFTKKTSSRTFHWLLTGDLEADGESRLVDYYSGSPAERSEYDVLPEVDFYKAGHHGSGTSSSEKLLSVIKPKCVAASCCAGAPEYTADNANTFPYKVTFEHLLKYTDEIYCTGMAVSLPPIGSGGKFTKKEWEYSPCNGNIVSYLAENSSGGAVKLYCSASAESVLSTEWYKNYRSAA